MENFIKNLARGAGKILREGFRTKFKINHKTASWDVVTEYDLAAEKFIIEKIKRRYPGHGILSEETGSSGKKENLWVIDPLDGTLAFTRGFAQFCTSISFLQKGKIKLAAVYDPVADELFFAKKGKGTYLNNGKVRIHEPNSLEFSNISMFLGWTVTTDSQKKFIYENLVIKRKLWRVGGTSASLSCAYVACGRFDTLMSMNLPVWDHCAGALLMQEAGAKVTDFKGRAFKWGSPFLIAASPNIHGEIVKVLRKM